MKQKGKIEMRLRLEGPSDIPADFENVIDDIWMYEPHDPSLEDLLAKIEEIHASMSYKFLVFIVDCFTHPDECCKIGCFDEEVILRMSKYNCRIEVLVLT